MENNNTTNKVKLKDITGTAEGTTEYQAYGNLGKQRREITGILGVNKKATAYLFGIILAKPLSVAGSAIGFATVTAVVSHQPLFLTVWWVLAFVGLGLGIFLESLSTAEEDSFVGFGIANLVKSGMLIVLVVKVYAIFMHYQTAEQISKALTNGVNSSTITETATVKNLKEDIADLKRDIASKEKEKETDAYAKLLLNTASTHKSKRDSATASIKAIEDALTTMKADKKAKGAELATLTESNVDKEKKAIAEDSEGSVWTFFALLVLFEIGGTILSIRRKKIILNGVDKTIAVTEEVKSRMYSKKAGLDETTNKLNSFRVANDIKANHNAITLIELESKVKEDEILLYEKARMSEIEVANKELELKVKMGELGSLKFDRAIQNIDAQIAQIKAIDINPINQNPQISTTPPPSRKMGFNTNVAKSDSMTKDDLINLAMDGVGEGDKLPPKSKLIDTSSRTQKTVYEEAMKDLVNSGRIELKKGRGYFATAQQYDFDLGDY
jgi:hypothetical protein